MTGRTLESGTFSLFRVEPQRSSGLVQLVSGNKSLLTNKRHANCSCCFGLSLSASDSPTRSCNVTASGNPRHLSITYPISLGPTFQKTSLSTGCVSLTGAKRTSIWSTMLGVPCLLSCRRPARSTVACLGCLTPRHCPHLAMICVVTYDSSPGSQKEYTPCDRSILYHTHSSSRIK